MCPKGGECVERLRRFSSVRIKMINCESVNEKRNTRHITKQHNNQLCMDNPSKMSDQWAAGQSDEAGECVILYE